jgi:hypothetical protein
LILELLQISVIFGGRVTKLNIGHENIIEGKIIVFRINGNIKEKINRLTWDKKFMLDRLNVNQRFYQSSEPSR